MSKSNLKLEPDFPGQDSNWDLTEPKFLSLKVLRNKFNPIEFLFCSTHWKIYINIIFLSFFLSFSSVQISLFNLTLSNTCSIHYKWERRKLIDLKYLIMLLHIIVNFQFLLWRHFYTWFWMNHKTNLATLVWFSHW